jgi:DNA-binding NarL/FixJ family response regulator
LGEVRFERRPARRTKSRLEDIEDLAQTGGGGGPAAQGLAAGDLWHDPVEAAARRDFWAKAREVLSQRPEQVLELQRQHFTTREIAERLGLEPATVRALKCGAVRRLRNSTSAAEQLLP